MNRPYRALDLITAVFVTILIVSNITANKLVAVGPLVFDGGTILFPLAYIFGDILTEVYGFQTSRRVIWIGFACLALTTVTLAIVTALPAGGPWALPEFNTPDAAQTAFAAVLGQTPRIALGSLAAFWAGEFVNSYILARLKLATQGRWLWSRTLSSTLVGQFVDTSVFLLIAFAGTFGAADLWAIFVSNYVFKVGTEAAFTPVTYWIVTRLKALEGVDVYDRGTDFNPLKVS